MLESGIVDVTDTRQPAVALRSCTDVRSNGGGNHKRGKHDSYYDVGVCLTTTLVVFSCVALVSAQPSSMPGGGGSGAFISLKTSDMYP